MSLTSLLTAPLKFFQKDVIAFLIVRRYDLGFTDDLIRYVSVKPTSSIATLRRKIWYLLDLPDYCEEVIILKSSENIEIPLTHLRKGNEPGRPFILEVWLPGKYLQSTTTIHNNMLTMGQEDGSTTVNTITHSSSCSCDAKPDYDKCTVNEGNSTMTDESLVLNKFRVMDNKQTMNYVPGCIGLRKSDISNRISNTSLIFKLQGKKSKDNLANILMKIQCDLSTLSQKLSSLENRIPS